MRKYYFILAIFVGGLVAALFILRLITVGWDGHFSNVLFFGLLLSIPFFIIGGIIMAMSRGLYHEVNGKKIYYRKHLGVRQIQLSVLYAMLIGYLIVHFYLDPPYKNGGASCMDDNTRMLFNDDIQGSDSMHMKYALAYTDFQDFISEKYGDHSNLPCINEVVPQSIDTMIDGHKMTTVVMFGYRDGENKQRYYSYYCNNYVGYRNNGKPPIDPLAIQAIYKEIEAHNK